MKPRFYPNIDENYFLHSFRVDTVDETGRFVTIPIRKAKYPPKHDNKWDKYIACVNIIEEIANKMGTKDRCGLVTWDNGELTRHRLGHLHSNAPQSVSLEPTRTVSIPMTD